MDEIWVVVLSAVGMLARVGQAMYGAGLVRSKNAAGTLVRHLVDFCVVPLVVWAVGAAILGQVRNGWLGVEPGLLFGNGRAGSGGVMWDMVLALLATGVVINTVVERARFAVVVVMSVMTAGIIFPVAGHWAWGGFLMQRGFVDLGGAAVAHVAGGVAALVAGFMVGARTGKFNRDGSSNAVPGHNVPVMLVGVLLVVVGWVPVLLAGAAGHDLNGGGVAVKTVVSGAAGGLMAMWLGRLRYGKVDIFLLAAGVMGGLVAISGGAHVMRPAFALLTGAVAGVAVPWVAIQLDVRYRLDDPGSMVAIHLVGGAWGTIAAGLFGGDVSKVGVQLVGLAAIGALAAGVSAGALLATRAIVGLRASEADEYDGLDLAEHDINAYPDFSQTMIKSYHLREA